MSGTELQGEHTGDDQRDAAELLRGEGVAEEDRADRRTPRR
jgi:hypothetical protein